MARILLVEDEQDIGAKIEYELNRVKHNSTWIKTGKNIAVELAKDDYDILIADMLMQDVLEQAILAKRNSNISVVAITSSVNNMSNQEIIETRRELFWKSQQLNFDAFYGGRLLPRHMLVKLQEIMFLKRMLENAQRKQETDF